jgi:hypothetical protein
MRKPAQPWLDEWESGDIEERVLDATKVDDAACAENPSVQVRGLARAAPGSGLRGSARRGNGHSDAVVAA